MPPETVSLPAIRASTRCCTFATGLRGVTGRREHSRPGSLAQVDRGDGHRRESFGPGFESSMRALRRLADAATCRSSIRSIATPMCWDRRIRSWVGTQRAIDGASYLRAVCGPMRRCWMIITDSGGVQEEAPSLGRPVLVLREKTERPEAVEAGTVKLVGTDEELIVAEAAPSTRRSQRIRAHDPDPQPLRRRTRLRADRRSRL